MAKVSKQEKLADQRIDTSFRRNCSNIGVNMMDIPKIFAEGRRVIAEGADDAALDIAIRAFVEKIKVK